MSGSEEGSSGERSSGEGDARGGLIVPEAGVDAAQALLLVQSLIASDDGRREYKANPAGAFERELGRRKGDFSGKDPKYGHIPMDSRHALEALSEEELAVLSRLDETFVKDGLYVEVPDPGKLFFK
jgi:hypothetical protein